MTVKVDGAPAWMMLLGIIKKKSILQVEYTNTLRAQGMERHEAMIAANHGRFRPILMTASRACRPPMAFGGIGIARIDGHHCLCLLLTLLVIPVIYALLDDQGIPPMLAVGWP